MTNPRHRDVVAFAELAARLIHRFTDREGVLDARGLSEDDVARLEANALAVLAADADAAQPFVAAFTRARQALSSELADEELAAATVVPGDAPASIPASLLDSTLHDVPRTTPADESFIEPALLETMLSGVARGSK